MVLLGDEAQVNAHFTLFRDHFGHTRCTICGKRTTGSEIILEAPTEHLGDLGHVESHFGLFGYNVSVGGR
jgi:hypothetical protein